MVHIGPLSLQRVQGLYTVNFTQLWMAYNVWNQYQIYLRILARIRI